MMQRPGHDQTDRGAEWYGQGLSFQCTQCGHCCTGPTGFVWVSDDELRAIAQALGMAAAQVERDFTRLLHGRRSLTEVGTEHGFDCVFLDRDSQPGKALCCVYQARPAQCRTWPFWPENLRHIRDWQRAARTCPGINQGPLIPIESIRIQRDATPA
ncbi:MAG: YkgJ family cysteine cluster protein [Phycisphaerales bacterium]|nr:YkgJ family cysteine cluster protein [Phycisphaerales bacterium]